MTLEEKLSNLVRGAFIAGTNDPDIEGYFSEDAYVEEILQVLKDEGYEKRSHILDGIKDE